MCFHEAFKFLQLSGALCTVLPYTNMTHMEHTPFYRNLRCKSTATNFTSLKPNRDVTLFIHLWQLISELCMFIYTLSGFSNWYKEYIHNKWQVTGRFSLSLSAHVDLSVKNFTCTCTQTEKYVLEMYIHMLYTLATLCDKTKIKPACGLFFLKKTPTGKEMDIQQLYPLGDFWWKLGLFCLFQICTGEQLIVKLPPGKFYNLTKWCSYKLRFIADTKI